MADRIPLGSGDLYMVEYAGTIPEDATIESAANLLGEIKNGASVEYSKEVYKAKSDNGKAQRTKTIDEGVILKCGVMTINKDTWKRMVDSARVTEDGLKKERTILIGGVDNESETTYVVRFVQRDAKYGDMRFTIIGKNTAGFTYAAQSNAETVLNGEFSAEPLIDDKGTLLKITESTEVA